MNFLNIVVLIFSFFFVRNIYISIINMYVLSKISKYCRYKLNEVRDELSINKESFFKEVIEKNIPKEEKEREIKEIINNYYNSNKKNFSFKENTKKLFYFGPDSQDYWIEHIHKLFGFDFTPFNMIIGIKENKKSFLLKIINEDYLDDNNR